MAETFGKSNRGYEWWGTSDGIILSQYTLSEDADVTKLTIYINNFGSTCNGKGLIYTDSGDAPNTRMGVSNPVSILDTQGGWLNFTFASPVSLTAGEYWMGIVCDVEMNAVDVALSGGDGAGREWHSGEYASPPNPFGSVEAENSYAIAIYATYSPTGGDTLPPQFGTISANTTLAGNATQISCTLTDTASGVSAWGFAWNNSGSMVNSSKYAVSGSPVTALYNGTWNATASKVWVQFWSNDTLNNAGYSPIQTFSLSTWGQGGEAGAPIPWRVPAPSEPSDYGTVVTVGSGKTYATIQAGVNAITYGTVKVYAGTYSESVTLKSNILVKAVEKGVTVSAGNSNAFYATAKTNITIYGFNIQGNGVFTNWDNGAGVLFSNVDYSTIQNCTAINMGLIGFYFRSGSDFNTLDYCEASYCVEHGVGFTDSSNNTITDVRSHHNDYCSFIVAYYTIQYCGSNFFSYCSAYSGLDNGFYADVYTRNNTFQDCLVYNFSTTWNGGGQGILLKDDYNVIDHCTVEGSLRGGVVLNEDGTYTQGGAKYCNITNTRSYNNILYGFGEAVGRNALFYNNWAWDNGVNAIYIEGGCNYNTLTYNSLFDDGSGTALDIEGNYNTATSNFYESLYNGGSGNSIQASLGSPPNPLSSTGWRARSYEPPPPHYTLTMLEPTVGGSVNPSVGNYSYYEGTNVTVIATASFNYVFAAWQIDGVNETTTSHAWFVVMDTNHQAKAYFAPIPVVVSIVYPQNTVYPTSSIPVEILASDGTIDVIWYNCKNGSSWIYPSNQTYTTSTSMSGFLNGMYVFYAYANNTDGNEDSETNWFTVATSTSSSAGPGQLKVADSWLTQFGRFQVPILLIGFLVIVGVLYPKTRRRR